MCTVKDTEEVGKVGDADNGRRDAREVEDESAKQILVGIGTFL
jgi:hypothetical protein